jgi:hypothetical protein
LVKRIPCSARDSKIEVDAAVCPPRSTTPGGPKEDTNLEIGIFQPHLDYTIEDLSLYDLLVIERMIGETRIVSGLHKRVPGRRSKELSSGGVGKMHRGGGKEDGSEQRHG